MFPQSVGPCQKRSRLRLLVSQLPLILPLEEQLASPGRDFPNFLYAALPKSLLEPSRLPACPHLKQHTWLVRPRLSCHFLHLLVANDSYGMGKPYLSRFQLSLFLGLASAQKGAVFFVLLFFLDSKPRKSLDWHRDFLLLALGAATGKRGVLQISPAEGLVYNLPSP